MVLEYWYMLPIAIVVAATAMASGVGGATFFAPIFLLGLGLSPEVAIGTGLITEVFGFASGLFAYSRKRLIDYKLGMNLVMVTVPAALLGSWLAGSIDPEMLKIILGMGLLMIALSFLRAPKHDDIVRIDGAIDEDFGEGKGASCQVTIDGEKICYTVCNKTEGRMLAGLGGLFVGLISTGLGELNGYFLLQRCRVPSRVSVATSVFVVAITAMTAAGGHLFQFVQSGGEALDTVFRIVIFTVPGVIVGAITGSSIANRIPQHLLELGLGILFMLIAALTIGETLL